jgi:hypothetical protein
VIEQLNADQELEVRAAYRETYSVENHGAAVEALYVSFTEKFGVSRETLRQIVTLDLAENKKQYSKLRRELAQRHAGQASARKARKAGAQGSGDPLLSPACCPVCLKEFSNAVIPRHENSAGSFCKGSWKRGVPAPKPERKPKKTYYDDRTESISVRTVSGGLPSSGRNHR